MAEFPENIVHDYRELQAGTIAVQHSNALIALAGYIHFVEVQKMKMMLVCLQQTSSCDSFNANNNTEQMSTRTSKVWRTWRMLGETWTYFDCYSVWTIFLYFYSQFVQCAQSLEFYAVSNNAIALSQTFKAHARNITG